MSFFQPNIGPLGRILRGLASLICFLLAWAAWRGDWSLILLVVSVLAGLFTALEACRGWCVARACGMKTPF